MGPSYEVWDMTICDLLVSWTYLSYSTQVVPGAICGHEDVMTFLFPFYHRMSWSIRPCWRVKSLLIPSILNDLDLVYCILAPI